MMFNKIDPILFKYFLKALNNTWKICLKLISQTRALSIGGFPGSLFQYECCIQAVVFLQLFFCSLPTKRFALLICIISGGYTQCDFYGIFSAAMICLPSKHFAYV